VVGLSCEVLTKRGACGKAAAPSVLVGLLPRPFRGGARTRYARRQRLPRAATCTTSRPWRSFLTRGRERRKDCRAPVSDLNPYWGLKTSKYLRSRTFFETSFTPLKSLKSLAPEKMVDRLVKVALTTGSLNSYFLVNFDSKLFDLRK